MGDVVLSTVVIPNLKKDFPDAIIDFITEKPSHLFLANNALINKIILFDRKSLRARLKLIYKVHSAKYDLVLDLFSNPASALMTFCSRSKYRAGFPYRGRKYAYNLYGPAERDKYHSAELHLKFLECLDLSSSFNGFSVSIDSGTMLLAEKLFSENFSGSDIVIGISPSGGWKSKKCPPEVFADIARKSLDTDNIKFLIFWGPGDYEDALKIKSLLPETKAVLAPETSILLMSALMKMCNAIIANDSGPMHIAAALGVKIIGLFGPTDPTLQGPFGNLNKVFRFDELDCIGCNLLECPKNQECFTNLNTKEIAEYIKQHLNEHNRNI